MENKDRKLKQAAPRLVLVGLFSDTLSRFHQIIFGHIVGLWSAIVGILFVRIPLIW